jgi:hypothetical protein
MKKLISFTFIFFLLSFILCKAAVRYVSHSGSNTPPYLTWETAADSIQKCIDYSSAGDTIIVANGTYYESLIVDKYLSLIGSSMDSTVIDGTNLANITIYFQVNGNGSIQYFSIKGKGENISQTTCIESVQTNTMIVDCKIRNALSGIGLVLSSSVVDRCIISNVMEGYSSYCDYDTCNPIIKNSIIFINNTSPFPTGILLNSGDIISSNNFIIGNLNSYRGIQSGLFLNASTMIAQDNSISGFDINFEGFADDTAIVYNNVSTYASERGFTINSKSDMRNNISAYNQTGVVGPTRTNSDFNLYWQNGTNSTDNLGEHDLVADPMFVNDTIPAYGGSYDYHLQAYSPAIDSGDPGILDVDGSRSDIGAYGGPLGESYKYQDLAPRPPVNLSGMYDSISIVIKWNRNTEADFNSYNIYRDTIPDFPVDSTTYVLSLTDTTYTHLVEPGVKAYYYKITARDNQGNESLPSEELTVLITGTMNNGQFTINSYKLFQNYPNPFNPSTKIGYRLKERGYVKLMVYDIKGEMIDVLVNNVQEAGYYEVEFSVGQDSRTDIASGIYLYRMEVIGEGKIPRFSDMKKMILLK